MKLSSFRDGSLDGSLLLVSKNLERAVRCDDVAPNLRSALETWEQSEGPLRNRAEALERDQLEGVFPFDPRATLAPLPRAPQFLDGSTYKSHGDLVAASHGTTMPAGAYTTRPVMYQGTSDDLLGAYDDIALPSEDEEIDFEAEVAAFTGAVPMGISAEAANAKVRLIGVMNDVSLRKICPVEVAAGFGLLQGKPRSSFAPIAVTLDELGDAWRDGRVHLRMQTFWNDELFGTPDAGEMCFSFGDLIAFAAQRRTLGAGTIVGSGTVSNHAYATVGSGCIAERRTIENLEFGRPKTGYVRFGDRIRIALIDADGAKVCGGMDQRVVQFQA